MKIFRKILITGIMLALIGQCAGLALREPALGASAFHSLAELETDLAGFHRSIVDIGETKLVTLQRGPSNAKRTYLLVHGYTADKTVWVRFAKSLGDDVRIVIPDLAGHGETAFNPAWDFSYDAQAARLKALIDRLGIEHVTIVGNSMGGAIAASFAMNYPKLTDAAVLIDPAGVRGASTSEFDVAYDQGKSVFLVNSQEEFLQMYAMTMSKAPWLPDFALRAIGHQYIERKLRYERIAQDLQKDGLEHRLSELHTPTLLVWGREDRIIDVSAAAAWKAKVPGLQVEIIDGIGHMPMLEIPAPTALIVKSWLATLRQK